MEGRLVKTLINSHKKSLAAHVSAGTLILAAFTSPAHAEHNFIVRGTFVCTSQGVTLPVEGAVVAVMRDKHYAVDPIDIETKTGPDGSFAVQWHSKDVDTYYAKLFLNDKEGVFLRDWWTLDVREFNSVTRGKSDAATIDLGVTEISRDGGSGSPRCAIWQGARHAWQEFVQATGQRPLIGEHGNYQVVMESTASGIVWTSRDTTHWEIGYPVGEFSDGIAPIGNPSALTEEELFNAYGTSVHEFGHALRHTADGSDNHFYFDSTRFLYAHSHELCESYPAGYHGNDGYGFNEGWSDYWQGSEISTLNQCLTQRKPTDFTQESAVARDLDALEAALGECAGIPSSVTGDLLRRQRRSLMFATLAGAGHEKIHSDADFRAAFTARFPKCVVPVAGTLSLTVPGATSRFNHLATARAPVKQLPERISVIKSHVSTLATQLRNAELASRTISPTVSLVDRRTILVKPALLRAQQAAAQLLQSRLEQMQANPPSTAILMTAAGQLQRGQDTRNFDTKARALAVQALAEQRSALQADNVARNSDDVTELTKQINAIRSGELPAAVPLLQDEGDDPDEVKALAPPKR
jgi:hypothetical protein